MVTCGSFSSPDPRGPWTEVIQAVPAGAAPPPESCLPQLRGITLTDTSSTCAGLKTRVYTGLEWSTAGELVLPGSFNFPT